MPARSRSSSAPPRYAAHAGGRAEIMRGVDAVAAGLLHIAARPCPLDRARRQHRRSPCRYLVTSEPRRSPRRRSRGQGPQGNSVGPLGFDGMDVRVGRPAGTWSPPSHGGHHAGDLVARDHRVIRLAHSGPWAAGGPTRGQPIYLMGPGGAYAPRPSRRLDLCCTVSSGVAGPWAAGGPTRGQPIYLMGPGGAYAPRPSRRLDLGYRRSADRRPKEVARCCCFGTARRSRRRRGSRRRGGAGGGGARLSALRRSAAKGSGEMLLLWDSAPVTAAAWESQGIRSTPASGAAVWGRGADP